MSNMSYCRFHNTVADMEDCVEALEETGIESLSESEIEKAKHLYELAQQYIEIYETEYSKGSDIVCPVCGSILTTVMGERSDCSYGEYKECRNCEYSN